MNAIVEQDDGCLAVGGVPIRKVASEVGTPVYIYDEARIRRNFRTFHKAFSRRYERFRTYFSMKANFVPAVVAALVSEGAGLDCSSMFEVAIAEALGVSPERMLFTMCYPDDGVLSGLGKRTIPVNFNGLNEFRRFRSFINGVDSSRLISFRLDPADSIEAEGIKLLGTKFGLPETEVIEAFKEASRIGFCRFGLHTMVGSNVTRSGHFSAVVARLVRVAEAVKAATGVPVESIDMGGGFGIPYGDADPGLDIDQTAGEVAETLKKMLEAWAEPLPWVIAEPGRYLVGDAGVLVASVCGVKRGARTFVGIDASSNIFMRRVLYGTSHRVLVDGHRAVGTPTEAVSVCGQLCDNNDIVVSDIRLPAVRVGDLVAILDAGAYGSVRASNFGAWPLPAEVMVSDGRYTVVRERQSVADFMRRFFLPADTSRSGL